MEYRRVGRTGLSVSRMTLGTNNFGTAVDEPTAVKVVGKAADLGINSIDTANTYTSRRSEEIIGKAVHGDRDRFVIATKVGMEVEKVPNGSGLSRKHILRQVELSLNLLQTDYVDIYYMHRFDPNTPLEETLKTLDQLVRDGKVRYVACSNFTVENIIATNDVSERLGLEKVAALQPPYNLLNREAGKDLIPYCESIGLGVFTYSALAGGFLTGKYTEGTQAPAGTRAASSPWFWTRMNKPENFEAVKKLKAVADSTKISLPQLALGWIARNKAVTSLIAGASRPEQVEENVKMLESRLEEAVLANLDAIPAPAPQA